MSTIAYAAFTQSREEATPGKSTTTEPPGIKTYVDALAALVPAEVLTLHALFLSATTSTSGGQTTITAPGALTAAFYGLIGLSVVFYIVARLSNGGKWDRLDYARVAIPPLAFVGWTMLQRTTAFDALGLGMSNASRSVLALFLATVLGIVAASLAYKADQKQP
jgi:hypothetical protein